MTKVKNYGGGGGLSKHRTSGKTPKSPKLRYKMMLEAQRNEKKGRPPLESDSVSELFKRKAK